MDEPCSALDPISTGQDRRADLPVEEAVSPSSSSPTTCSKPSRGCRIYRVLLASAKLIEFDKTEKIFTTPSEQTGRRTTSQAGLDNGRVPVFLQEMDELRGPFAPHGADWPSRPSTALARLMLDRDPCAVATWCSRARPRSTSPNAKSTRWPSTFLPCQQPMAVGPALHSCRHQDQLRS